jgi:hypothetical protein
MTFKRRSSQPRIRESVIQTQVLQYLGYRGIKAFRINAGMVHSGEGRGKRMIRMAPKGFSDIIGVMPPDENGQNGGRAIFCEVKARGNKPTQMQLDFLQEMRDQGAIAFVAYDISDVEKELDNAKSNA